MPSCPGWWDCLGEAAGYCDGFAALFVGMKSPVSKLVLIACAAALGSVFAAPVMRAADDAKKKRDADLRKYDKNGNGKLDPDEKAAMEADIRKAKEKRKKG